MVQQQHLHCSFNLTPDYIIQATIRNQFLWKTEAYVLRSKGPLLTTTDFARDNFSVSENSLKSVTAAETKEENQISVIAASHSIAVCFYWLLYLAILLGWQLRWKLLIFSVNGFMCFHGNNEHPCALEMFPKLTSYMLGLSQTFRGRWEKEIEEKNQYNTRFKVSFLLKGISSDFFCFFE